MNRPRLIIKILNLINSLLIVFFMLKFMHLFAFLNPFSILHFALAAIVVYGLKMWLEISYGQRDPIKENKVTNALFYSGLGFVALGLLIKIMHWPYLSFFLSIGATLVFASAVISFFVEDTKRESSPDILDDLD